MVYRLINIPVFAQVVLDTKAFNGYMSCFYDTVLLFQRCAVAVRSLMFFFINFMNILKVCCIETEAVKF